MIGKNHAHLMLIVVEIPKNAQSYFGKAKTMKVRLSLLDQHAMIGKLVHAKILSIFLQETQIMQTLMSSVITPSCSALKLMALVIQWLEAVTTMEYHNQIGDLYQQCTPKMKLTKRFASKILIVRHLIVQMDLLKVLVSNTCGNTMVNTKPLKVAGTFQSAVIHMELHLTQCLMEGKFNGSALQTKRKKET